MIEKLASFAAVAAIFGLAIATAPTAHGAPLRAPSELTRDPRAVAGHLVPAWMTSGWHGATTLQFPKESDTVKLQDNPWMWHEGDYVEGMRATSLSSISTITGKFFVENSISSCGEYKIDVLINERIVGRTVLPSASAELDFTMRFPRIVGPRYTIRYIGAETVASGCGSIKLDFEKGEVTLR